MGNSKNISLIFIAGLPALFILIGLPVTSIFALNAADKQKFNKSES